jgi:hypothetical protein
LLLAGLIPDFVECFISSAIQSVSRRNITFLLATVAIELGKPKGALRAKLCEACIFDNLIKHN